MIPLDNELWHESWGPLPHFKLVGDEVYVIDSVNHEAICVMFWNTENQEFDTRQLTDAEMAWIEIEMGKGK